MSAATWSHDLTSSKTKHLRLELPDSHSLSPRGSTRFRLPLSFRFRLWLLDRNSPRKSIHALALRNRSILPSGFPRIRRAPVARPPLCHFPPPQALLRHHDGRCWSGFEETAAHTVGFSLYLVHTKALHRRRHLRKSPVDATTRRTSRKTDNKHHRRATQATDIQPTTHISDKPMDAEKCDCREDNVMRRSIRQVANHRRVPRRVTACFPLHLCSFSIKGPTPDP